MSKLESFIRRMQAQAACINAACDVIAETPGVVFELGLGNGRTYDHLREHLGEREIYAFDYAMRAHPDFAPDADHTILGEIEQTLPDMVKRFRGQVALVHTDIGSGKPAENTRLAHKIGRLVEDALCDGAVVLSDRDLGNDALTEVPAPHCIHRERYHYYIYNGVVSDQETVAPLNGDATDPNLINAAP